ncbi:cytochrome c oxidase assembly factor CtaG [Mangrovibacillus cuniculi]|uniref:Cytochrome c oxidase assembly factor CtaG n=1 Tax=Mangrovibacillus cuniculi TaxID=2593652 RepID=A0A7S8HEU0_9BACI|nr:cytochrome c oxidase assembly factor CtaG [Mangrovibacillus cuniculi]QPC46219.1 cytochrome c oxidase assembly factor CtaG [Mangrovibacillus cuniculi]
MPINIFGFVALWSPYLLAATIITYLGTMFYLTKKNKLDSERYPISIKHIIYLTLTFALFYIVKGSPIDLLGHITFTMHMTQMGLFYLLLPPLLIVSFPNWWWKQLLQIPILSQLFHFFTKPLIALIVFNGMFSFYHIPLIFDAVKVDATLHTIYTVVLFFFAICMWWPLVNKLEDEYQLHGLKKIGYIFADGILLTPACALIIFASSGLYLTYSDPQMWLDAMALCVPAGVLDGLSITGPELFHSMGIVEDQRTGGVIMKVLQEIIYGVVLGQVFFAWAKKEREKDEVYPDQLA